VGPDFSARCIAREEIGLLGPDDVRKYVEEMRLDAEVLLVKEGHTSGLAADSLNIDVESIAKTVVFVDEDRRPVLAIVRGGVKVRQGEFARMVGAKKLRLATRDEVLEITGFQAGGVSPIANLCKQRVFMDEGLMRSAYVYAGGGSEKHILKIRPDDMLRESGAKLMEIPVQSH
jgi:Cys-tRNA(Pro) deacylase